MILSLRITILLAVSCCILSSTSMAAQLSPITIAYTLDLESDKLGNARLGKMETSLSKVDNGYSVTATTKAQGLAAILLGSSLQLSCQFDVEKGRAVTNKLQVGRANQTPYVADYDWAARKINFVDGESLDMPQGYILDDCSLPFVAALLKDTELSGEILYVLDAKKRRLRGYKHRSTQDEVISTPLGELNTLRITLEREFKPERTFTLWLSPDNDYLPLKMEERRKSRTTILMVDDIHS